MTKKTSLTPEEYELHLRNLSERLKSQLETGGGDIDALLHDAEHVLELAEEFPEVFARYEGVGGLTAEVLARRRQRNFLGAQTPERESPGCLLGWLRWPRRGR
jgi:hypothetical protein